MAQRQKATEYLAEIRKEFDQLKQYLHRKIRGDSTAQSNHSELRGYGWLTQIYLHLHAGMQAYD